MRRLLLLLLALAGVACAVPGTAAHAARPAPHHAAMPGGCHDEGQATFGHACVGCAVAPDEVTLPAPLAERAGTLRAARSVAVAGRRPGSDPPPPRAAA